jgi:hypothetical protein
MIKETICKTAIEYEYPPDGGKVPSILSTKSNAPAFFDDIGLFLEYKDKRNKLIFYLVFIK